MTDGQPTSGGAADFAAVDAAMTSLGCTELDRSAHHARQLRAVLVLAEACAAAGWHLGTVAQIALALGTSENRAYRLLSQARALQVLPGALEALERGLLTVEQAGTVVTCLAVMDGDPAGQVAVWLRLRQRLVDAANGTAQVLPPARLAETLRRWVIAHDRDAAARRRKEALRARGVDYRRHDDGTYDLFARGLTGPDAHAILSRIAARATPWGIDDDRTADQRRLDAFRDLLLGRDQLPREAEDQPLDGCTDPGHDTRCEQCRLRPAGAAPCGCLPGQAAPCGADIAVLLPYGASTGSTDELAELAGHGPLEPDLLEQLLLNTPTLRPVWVDEHGTVVAVGDTTLRPQRGDPTAVRDALLALQAMPPPALHPRHPLDHREVPPSAVTFAPAGLLRSAVARPARISAADGGALAAAALGTTTAHPPSSPGAYRVGRRLRRLIDLRAPRCEWPGCGARAVNCDAEHDRAWPDGPTCACNLGPCCRRHHRIKQLGFTKTRGQHAEVTWTDPAGRAWLSPNQHQPPAPPLRPPRPLPTANPLDELSPLDLDDELWHLGLLPDDPGPWKTETDVEHDDESDPLGKRILRGDTGWTLDLADPYQWQPISN